MNNIISLKNIYSMNNSQLLNFRTSLLNERQNNINNKINVVICIFNFIFGKDCYLLFVQRLLMEIVLL